MALRLRRGTALERLTIVPAAGELIYTTDTKKLYIGDGVITGGNEVNTEIKGLLADDLYLSTYKLLGSGLELDGATGNIAANLITGNLIGSVFADDSTKIIDGITGKVVGPIRVSVNDIEILGGNAGQVLSTDGAGNLTWTAGGSGGSATLAGLNDVSVGSLTTNEVLTWSGTAWVNSPITLSGQFVGDISGSVFADDSTKIIDGNTGNVFANTLVTSTMYSDSEYVSFGDPLTTVSTRQYGRGGGEAIHEIRGTSTGNANAGNSFMTHGITNIKISRNSCDDPQPVQANDSLYSIRVDGWGSGSEYFPCSGMFFDVGNSVSSSIISGSIRFYTGNATGGGNFFVFDDVGDLTVPNGIKTTPLESAPASPVAGTYYTADGDNWNPSSKVGNKPYPVFYDGTSYNSLY